MEREMASSWKGWREDQSSNQGTDLDPWLAGQGKKQNSLFETWAKYMQIGQFVKGSYSCLFWPLWYQTSSLQLPAGLHTKKSTAAWLLHHASKEICPNYDVQLCLCLRVCFLMSGHLPHWCFKITPPTDGRCPHLVRAGGPWLEGRGLCVSPGLMV